MAELDLGSRYNLIDCLKNVQDNKFVPWAETLTEDSPFLFDLQMEQATGILSNEGSREVSLPTPQIIKVGDGHDSSTVRWDTFTENISIFKDRASIPKDVYDLKPDKIAYRAKIEDRHMAGFGQGVTNHFFYGTSVASPEKFDGLDVRYSIPDATDPTNPSSAAADPFVFDAGGTGNNTMSVWLIQQEMDKFSGITPINDPQMGIDKEDVGFEYVTAENSKQRRDLITEFSFKVGLNIADQRAVARIRNIDTAVADLDASFLQLIFQAEEEVFKGSGQIFAYVTKRMMTFLKIMAEAKQNVIYDTNNIYGIPLHRIGNILLRSEDALNITETAVAAL